MLDELDPNSDYQTFDPLVLKASQLTPEEPIEKVQYGVQQFRMAHPDKTDDQLWPVIQFAHQQHMQGQDAKIGNPLQPTQPSNPLSQFGPEARAKAAALAKAENTSGSRQIGDALQIFGQGFMKSPDISGAIRNIQNEQEATNDKYLGEFDKNRATALQDFEINRSIDKEKTQDQRSKAFAKAIHERYPDLPVEELEGKDAYELAKLYEARRANEARLKAKGVAQGSEAQKYVDRNFGKDYAEYVAGGGFSSVAKNLNQLKSVVGKLDKGGPNVSGGALGLLPKKVRDVVTPEGAAVQDAIEQTVLTTLRQTLGAQFTENEGKRVLDYTFNPRQSEAENQKRLNRLITQLENQAKAKAEAANYYEQNGTLKGYKGNPLVTTAEGLIGDSKNEASSAHKPGDIVTVKGKQYKVGQDGDTLEPL